VSHTVLIGRRNQPIYYGLTDDRTINYDELRELAIANSPKLIIVGGSALPREIDLQLCGEISRECGAYLHADISHTATFIAGGLHQTAFPHCDFITFNTVKNLRGPNGGVLLFRTEVENLVHRSVFPMTQGGANETNMFGKFVAFLEWKRRDISQYATEIVRQARCMASTLMADGITVTTGGTDCHIVLLELMGNKRSGADWERLFEEQGVLVNKNLIPNDTRPPSQTSGLRIGTANLAILNYDLEDTRALAGWMGKGLRGEHVNDELIPYLIKKYHNQHPWLCQ
jgi:glycine hydroxymethyltransferase